MYNASSSRLAVVLVLAAILAISGCRGSGGSGSAGGDTSSETGTELDSDTLGDTASDSASETDTDTASDSDTGDLPPCPPTTLEETIFPLLPAEPLAGPDRSEWGLTEVAPGEPFVLRDDLGVGESETDPLGDPSSLAFAWHVTDSQIIDEESPSRLIHGDMLYESSYRYQENLTAQLLEAAVRTAGLFSAHHRFDFALLTGDMVDNIQHNELEWFYTVLEGGLVDPDSGDDDDPIPGPGNDPHDPFIAQGFPADVPWYVTTGNHDLLELGNGPLVSWMLADPTGDSANKNQALSWLNDAVTAVCLEQPWYQTESPIPERCYMPPKLYFDDSEVIPDYDRELFDRHDWTSIFFDTITAPVGHGYQQSNLDSGWGSYVVEEPVPGSPLVLVALDTVSTSGQWGTFDAPRREWLLAALDAAENEGRPVIVASHHTANNIDDEGERQALVAMLEDHPGVVAHLGGHSHLNRITPHPAPEGLPAEHGFWEIETSATGIWPQQTRLVELVDERDGTGSIYCTMLDYRIPGEMPVLAGGRFYGLYDVQDGSGENGSGSESDRNAILRVAFPPETTAALAELEQRPVHTFQLAYD